MGYEKGCHLVDISCNNNLKTGESPSVSISGCLTLCDPMDRRPQAPLSMKFSRQEYWSGLPGPFPGDLPDPGTEPRSLAL